MQGRRVETILLLPLIASLGCEAGGRSPTPRYGVDDAGLDLGLTLPRLSGWERDPDVELEDGDAGGDALVLHRMSAPAGSPKITVTIAPAGPKPLRLQGFLNQNLRTMGDLERQSGMRITRVAQKPLEIGPRRAYVVRHEFTMGVGDHQLAFTQLAAILVVDGRGVTVTAVGRTELFHPLAEQITPILTGLHISTQPEPAEVIEVTVPEVLPDETNEPARPVDLGNVGGK